MNAKSKQIQAFREIMNRTAILHTPDSRYCFAVDKNKIVIRLRMAVEDSAIKVVLIHGCKYEFVTKRSETPMEICYSDELYNYYEKELELEDVRLAYIFSLTEDGTTYYYSEDGVTEDYEYKDCFYNFFQFPYINKTDILRTTDWMRNAVFYQIFVDRFNRGDFDKDDSYITMEWGDAPTPKSFAGGDLAGIIEKLDYLEDLGINAIYLTPVFRSSSNHKYNISDYFNVDPQFGSNEVLVRLVREAHSRNIKVVLDAVFNHCSIDLSQFKDVCEKGKQSKYYDWFIVDGDRADPEERNYECFATCADMPKLNTSNPEVEEFLLDITRFWMDTADIDGWRLDVSDEISHEFWRKFRKTVKQKKPDCVIIGENWHDAYPYLMGDQYDSIMNYSFTKACLDYFVRGKFNAERMAARLNEILMRNMKQVNYMMLNLLDSHDTPRFFTEAGKNRDILLAAVSLLTVFPGASCIYYGTEICTEGGGDPDSRRCFDWNEENWDFSTWNAVQELIAMKSKKLLGYGSVRIEAENEMLKVTRQNEEKAGILYINMSGKAKILEPAGAVFVRGNGYADGQIAKNGFAMFVR